GDAACGIATLGARDGAAMCGAAGRAGAAAGGAAARGAAAGAEGAAACGAGGAGAAGAAPAAPGLLPCALAPAIATDERASARIEPESRASMIAPPTPPQRGNATERIGVP